MNDAAINPEVKKSLADMSGERVQERSEQDYPRHLWSSVKNGHYRFALAGVAISAPISAAIGAVVAATVGWALAPIIIPAFIAAGSLMAVEGFGSAGAAAASRASGLAEKHARILDAEQQGKTSLTAIDDHLMHNGAGHHFEIPTSRDKGKFYSMKSGLVGGAGGVASGAVIGAGLGGVAAHMSAATGVAAVAAHAPALGAIATAAAHVPLLGSAVSAVAAGLTGIGLAAASAPLVATLAVAGAVTFGLFGLTFGLERKVLKSSFDMTDANIKGNLQHSQGPDLGRAQSQESDYALEQHRLRRQEEITRLEKSYNDKISWGALSGRFKGFAGALPGVLVGAAVGALALGAIAVTASIPFAAAIAAHSLILPLFAAAGGVLGMKVFTESGTEAGAEATARAIDNEFERNRALRARGITPAPGKEAKESWLNPKAGLIMGLMGAAAGVALTLAMAPVIATMIPIHLTTMALTGISAIIGGGVGAAYGLGPKSLKAMSKPFTAIYDKVIGSGHDSSGLENSPPIAQTQPAYAYEKVTAEDMARISERTLTGSGKSFAQTISSQQLQAQPANLTIGA